MHEECYTALCRVRGVQVRSAVLHGGVAETVPPLVNL